MDISVLVIPLVTMNNRHQQHVASCRQLLSGSSMESKQSASNTFQSCSPPKAGASQAVLTALLLQRFTSVPSRPVDESPLCQYIAWGPARATAGAAIADARVNYPARPPPLPVSGRFEPPLTAADRTGVTSWEPPHQAAAQQKT